MNIHVKKQLLFVKWQKQIYIHFRCHIMFGCHKKEAYFTLLLHTSLFMHANFDTNKREERISINFSH